MKEKIREVVPYLPLILTVAALFINTFVIGFVRTSGKSMIPTVPQGSFVLAKKLIFSIDRDDIVIAHADGITVIKRAIGLPGETVHICEDGSILINGKKIADEFPSAWEESAPFVGKDVVLADDEYFLIGDNRPNSRDSRYFGPIHRNRIFGKVVHIFASDQAKSQAEQDTKFLGKGRL